MTRPTTKRARGLLGAGDYYLAEREFPAVSMRAQEDASALCCNLQLLRGVGPKTERKLKAGGYRDLASLAEHARWGGQACEIMAAIERQDARTLSERGAAETDLAGFYIPAQVGFVDIETTSLCSTQPLFLVGVMGCRDDGTMIVRQFLARSYDEEASVLLATADELERFRAVATYNGRRFDLPYIRDRMAYHGIDFASEHFHIDLLRVVRRLYREVLPDCRLVTAASHLIGYERHGDIPSYMIPEVYHEFVRTRNPALIRPILEHNAMDLYALALILRATLDRAQP